MPDFFKDDNVIKETPCPLCQEIKFSVIYQKNLPLKVVKCNRCAMIYVNPRLVYPEKKYWKSRVEHEKSIECILNGTKKSYRDPNYLEDIKIISKHLGQGNLLDIGSGAGLFMRLLKSRGYNLYGIEPSPSLSAIGRDYFGLNIITGYLEEGGFRENFFTGVTLIDVLEHIPEPLEFLKEIHRILEPRGILFIRLPNGGFNLLKLLILKQILKLEGFDIFNETEHVNHYTTRTLQNLLTKSGFEIIEILPAHPVQAGARHGARGTSNPEYLSPWYRGLPIKTARILSFYLGLVFYFMLCRKILPFVPNLFIIARCKKEWC